MGAKRGENMGSSNPNWRGGRLVASNGYVLVRRPEHPLADVRGYVYEHRLVAEQIVGRPLRKGEQVHHKDGNKQNNSPNNLEVTASSAHHRLRHRTKESGRRLPGEPNPLICCACGCEQQFPRYDATGRPRTYISGHNPQRATTREAVIDCLMIGTIHRQEISDLSGIPVACVAQTLSKLHQEGLVRNSGDGYWTWRELCLV